MIESFKLPNITPETISGSIVSFKDEYGGLPLKSCTSLISGYQEGSGTPSPDNVRPLHAFSSANIGQTSGYGEYFQGLLKGTYGFVDLGTLNWSYSSFQTTNHYFHADKPDDCKDKDDDVGLTNCCNSKNYVIAPSTAIMNNTVDKAINVGGWGNNTNWIYIADTDYTDAATFKAAMSGVYLIYELKTPTTPTITPEQFATLCQAFGITGNTYTFTFGQSIYKGSIDWKRGVVVATYGISTFKGLDEEGWNISGEGASRRFRIELNGSNNTQSISDRFSWVSSNNGVWGKFRIASNLLLLLDNTSVMADVSALKTWLSNNNASFAYPLAEPFDIPLGGIQLLTQQGVNHICCDTGDTEVNRLKVN